MFFQKVYEGRNQWWRWLLTILGTLLIWLLGQIPLLIFVNAEAERLNLNLENITELTLHPDLDRNLFLILSLIPFALGLTTLRFLVSRLHKRSLLSVMTGRSRFDWRRVWVAFAIWLLVMGGAAFAVLPSGSYTYQFNPSAFWPLLIIALLLIPIQTTAEEVFFRGYLTQGMSLLLKNKLAILILISLIFASIHIGNPEFYMDYAKGMLGYLAISLLLGIVAIMDDGLELPCGIHAANNIFAAAILSSRDGSFTTDSLFVSTVRDLMYWSPHVDIALCVVTFFIFSYLFGWRFSTLLEPIVPPAHPGSGRDGERRGPDADVIAAEP